MSTMTAAQLKEQNGEAYSQLEGVLKKLHTEDLNRFMELYGYTDVKHVINHYMKYVGDGDGLVMTDPSGRIFRWSADKHEWALSGSLYLN